MTRVKRQRGFRYGRIKHSPAPDIIGRVNQARSDESLSGVVQGKQASDLEERLARAFYKARKPFAFQVDIPTRVSKPGEERKVDFIVDNVQPVEPKGYISHYRTIAQKGEDTVRELFLNEYFTQNGMRPLITVPYYMLETQEMADSWVRRNL